MKNDYDACIASHPEWFVNPTEEDRGIHIVADPAARAQVEEAMRARLRESNLPESWAKVGVVYRDQYITLLRDAVFFEPGHRAGTYIRQVNTGGANGVVILPVVDGEICLVRIFRHALRRWVHELPRGFGEASMTSEENARRELMEETGATAQEMIPLGAIDENSGASDGRVDLFFARLDAAPQDARREEGIDRLCLVKKDAFFRMIDEGELADAYTLCAAFRAVLKKLL